MTATERLRRTGFRSDMVSRIDAGVQSLACAVMARLNRECRRFLLGEADGYCIREILAFAC